MVVTFSGLLVFDFTVFILTVARSLRLWNNREPFLRRLFIDGPFMTYSCHFTADVTISSRPSLLWVCTSSFWGSQPADHTVSVICSLNLLNIIVLVRHFLDTLYSINLMLLCFSSPLGDRGKWWKFGNSQWHP